MSDLPEPGTVPLGEIERLVVDKLGDVPAKMRDVKRRRSASITEREHRALELVAAGAGVQQVATVLNVSKGAAHNLIDKALAKRALEINATTLDEARAVYVTRLEMLLRRWLPQAISPSLDDKAAQITLSILDRYARLYPFEAPQRVEVEGEVRVTHDEVAARRAAILDDLAEVHRRRVTIDGEFLSEAS